MAKSNVLSVIIGLFVLTADSGAQNRMAAPSANYVLVFSDEFNQPNGSRPDPAKWATPRRLSDVRWRRWISESKSVAYIKNGSLVCRAIPNKENPSDTAAMLTGAVETNKLFSFQYGKVEVRMKTNLKQGNSPAAWMRAQDDVQPFPYAEIDIFEQFDSQKKAQHAAHTHQTYTLKRKGVQHEFSERVSVNKWHVYSLEWTENSLIWSVDGQVVATYKKSADPHQLAEGQWVFDRPFFLILNQSLGNGHAGAMPDVKGVYETRFDWIRVYQREDSRD